MKRMKKIFQYILLFLSGIALGVLFFSENDFFSESELTNNRSEKNYLAVEKPINTQKSEFVQSAIPMLGKEIIVNGTIQEGYKNSENELVLYVSVSNIPFMVSCTLENTDMQIFSPIKLGEMISVKGQFTQIDTRMELESCMVLRRESDSD